MTCYERNENRIIQSAQLNSEKVEKEGETKETKNKENKQKAVTNTVDSNSTISIMILNVKGLKHTDQNTDEWIKSKRDPVMFSIRDPLI